MKVSTLQLIGSAVLFAGFASAKEGSYTSKTAARPWSTPAAALSSNWTLEAITPNGTLLEPVTALTSSKSSGKWKRQEGKGKEGGEQSGNGGETSGKGGEKSGNGGEKSGKGGIKSGKGSGKSGSQSVVSTPSLLTCLLVD